MDYIRKIAKDIASKKPRKELEVHKVEVKKENAIKRKNFDFECVFADWKDIDGLVERLKNALKKFGVNMYDDPRSEGSDMYSFILTKSNLSKKDLLELAKNWGL